MVGRQAELAAVGAFLAGRPTGPRALVLQGEAGIGKTTLVRAALEQAAARGLAVLAARPAAGERELPFAALADLLDGVDLERVDLAPAQREALAVALGRAAGPEADEHAVARGVLEVLRGSGQGLLAVDGAQWLDGPTASALAFALRRLGPAPVRVLLAARVPAGLGIEDWDDVRRIDVAPLTTTELGAVVHDRLGFRPPRPALKALARASGGNPMFALELACDGGAHAAPLPAALDARLQALDAEVRRALGMGASARRPSLAILQRAGMEAGALSRALDTGILELADGHRDTRAAPADESAVAELDDAAAEADRQADHAGAAAFLMRAAELSPDPGGAREAAAAEALVTAGDIAAARRVAAGLVERLPAGVPRARARTVLVTCRVGTDMSYDEALAQHRLSLADAGADRQAAAVLQVAIGFEAIGACRLTEGLDAFRRAQVPAGERSVGISARAGTGFIECMLGHGVTEAAEQAYAEWQGSTLWADAYSPRMALGCVRLHATEFAEAERLLTEELRSAEARGHEEDEAVARGHIAECQLRAGRWPEALANARLALEHAHQAASAQVSTAASAVVAAIEARLGAHEPAVARATAGLAQATATGDFWFILNHRAVLGLVALAERRPDAAIDALEPAWALIRERGLGDLSMFPVAHHLGEALAALGRLDEVAALARALHDCPAGGRPWCRAMAARLDALAASGRGDHAAARRAIAAALEAHGGLAEPFEHARTVHVAGWVERRARGWGAARAALVEARDRYTELGAARWAERAAEDLRRLPGRRPVPAGELTAREQEVAALAAAGLANKQIAARLFLSRGTVETHLGSIYAKLGIHSRAQLAARAGGDPPQP